MKKLILIDGNALVHRAFHALPPSLNSKGVMTNAVFGFTSVLLKMIKDLTPDYIAATFDLAGPTFRHDQFAEYKIHRVKAAQELYDQIPLIKNIVRAMGIPIYEKEGFEADDLIGSIATKVKEGNKEQGTRNKANETQVVIVTGDLDTLQLVDGDKVTVFTLRKGITDTVTYNEKEVAKRYGIKPSQIIDFKALKGDPSDNIPGVAGIGEKTAATLIQEFGSIEKLYEKIESRKWKVAGGKEKQLKAKGLKSKAVSPYTLDARRSSLSPKLVEKLLADKEMAFFSKQLATIVCNVDIPINLEDMDWRKHLDQPEIERLMREYSFYSLLKRLPEVGLVASHAPALPLDLAVDQPDQYHTSPTIIIENKKDIDQLIAGIKNSSACVIYREGETWYFSPQEKVLYSAQKNNNACLSRVLNENSVLKIGHDLKPILKTAIAEGLAMTDPVFDIKIAYFLLNPDLKDYSLERIVENEFSASVGTEVPAVIGWLWKIKARLDERLVQEKLTGVYEKIEAPLIKVLAQMEHHGIKVDTEGLKKLSASVKQEIDKLEREIYKSAGTQFNINSPQQLGEVLYVRLGLKGKVKKTGGGSLSTAAPELEKLIDEHPIIELILRYREIQKLMGTYIEPLPTFVNPKTGRVSTTLNQTGSATGRLSSQDPNLQNIPIRTEIGQEFRKSFVSEPGFKLVAFDYSQLELRIVAHISHDEKMIAAFKRGEDIHTRTAAEIFGVEPKAVTSAMRRQAKVLNFGLIYGMGILGFQRAASVNRERAREFIDRYMNEFYGVAKYMDETKSQAKRLGYVQTIFGRKRYLPDIKSGIPQLVAQAERIAINMPVQGTESDLLKMAMATIDRFIDESYDHNHVRMILQIHDELLFEIKNDLVSEVAPKIKKIMENVYSFSVPIIVDAKAGDNWRDMERV